MGKKINNTAYKFLLLLVFFANICTICSSQEDDHLKTKISILVGKGIKQKNQGKLEDAIQSFEEAHKLDTTAAFPLLVWAETLQETGLYKEAEEIINKVNIDKANIIEKSQYYLIKANIYLANEKLQEAREILSLAHQLQNRDPRICMRLALLCEIIGDREAAKSIYNSIENVTNINPRDRSIAYLLAIRFGNIFKIFENATSFVEMVKKHDSGDDLFPWGWSIIKSQIPFLLVTFPIALGGYIGLSYCILVIALLIFMARHATNDMDFRKDAFFAIIVLIHVVVTYIVGYKDTLLYFYKNRLSIYDPELISSRMLIASNVCSYFLMLAYALFSSLPNVIRPKKIELFSTFLFCWWFIFLVLLIQSNKVSILQWFGITISIFACILFILFMPLGRYLITFISKYTGWKLANQASYFLLNIFEKGGNISFTDAKVLENEMIEKLYYEKYEDVIKNGNVLQGQAFLNLFPNAWLALNRALIEIENFPNAYKNINNYFQTFAKSSYINSGKIQMAYYKSIVGDFSECTKLINQSIPEYAIVGKTSEELALLFLAAGRCNIFYNELVEASINLNKGLKLAISSLTKLYIIYELVRIEFKLNRPNKILELYNIANSYEIKGIKSKNMVILLYSLFLYSNNKIEEALNNLKQACEICSYNNTSKYWWGYLLCKENKFSEAETVLESMIPDTYETHKLMEIVTTKKLQ